MKNYLFYITVIFLFAFNFSNRLFAQLSNEKHKALNDYLETIIKDTTQIVFVAKEKINSNETLKIFGLNDLMIIDSKGNGKGDYNLYKKKDFKKMKEEYKDRCLPGKRIWCNEDLWSKDSFRYKKVILESMNTNEEIEIILDKYNRVDIDVYGFSEPIYYQDKKYLMFTVIKSHLAGYSLFIIIMKKIKGKWITAYKGGNPNIIN